MGRARLDEQPLVTQFCKETTRIDIFGIWVAATRDTRGVQGRARETRRVEPCGRYLGAQVIGM